MRTGPRYGYGAGMSPPKIRTGREVYARFFEEPSREALRALLQNHLGETADLDFKREWPARPDLAKHILGFANAEGGALVIGVDERSDKTLDPVGVLAFTDKVDLHSGIKKFLPASLRDNVSVEDFHYEETEYPKIKGLRFQVLIVDSDASHLPYLCASDGDKIRAGAIYVHREGGTSEATHDELQAIINRRIGTNYSSASELKLKEHLEQLKILYGEIDKNVVDLSLFGKNALVGMMAGMTRANPSYPKEGYADFISRLIERKKSLIEKAIGS